MPSGSPRLLQVIAFMDWRRVPELAFGPHAAENRRASWRCGTLALAEAADHQRSLPMPFLALHVVLSFVLDLLHLVTQRDHDRALELLLLRQQLRLYERKAKQPRPSRWEKVVLASLAARLPDLSRVCLVFTPATLLRWHREIVKRRWTFDNAPKPGRPPTSAAC